MRVEFTDPYELPTAGPDGAGSTKFKRGQVTTVAEEFGNMLLAMGQARRVDDPAEPPAEEPTAVPSDDGEASPQEASTGGEEPQTGDPAEPPAEEPKPKKRGLFGR